MANESPKTQTPTSESGTAAVDADMAPQPVLGPIGLIIQTEARNLHAEIVLALRQGLSEPPASRLARIQRLLIQWSGRARELRRVRVQPGSVPAKQLDALDEQLQLVVSGCEAGLDDSACGILYDEVGEALEETPAHRNKRIEYGRGGCASGCVTRLTPKETIAMLSDLRVELEERAKLPLESGQAQRQTLYPDYERQSPHLQRRHLHSSPGALVDGLLTFVLEAPLGVEGSAQLMSRASHVAADGVHAERSVLRGGVPTPLALDGAPLPKLQRAVLSITRPPCDGCEEEFASNKDYDILAAVGQGNVNKAWLSWSVTRPHPQPYTHIALRVNPRPRRKDGVRCRLVDGRGWVREPYVPKVHRPAVPKVQPTAPNKRPRVVKIVDSTDDDSTDDGSAVDDDQGLFGPMPRTSSLRLRMRATRPGGGCGHGDSACACDDDGDANGREERCEEEDLEHEESRKVMEEATALWPCVIDAAKAMGGGECDRLLCRAMPSIIPYRMRQWQAQSFTAIRTSWLQPINEMLRAWLKSEIVLSALQRQSESAAAAAEQAVADARQRDALAPRLELLLRAVDASSSREAATQLGMLTSATGSGCINLNCWRNGELIKLPSSRLGEMNAAVEVWVLAKEAEAGGQGRVEAMAEATRRQGEETAAAAAEQAVADARQRDALAPRLELLLRALDASPIRKAATQLGISSKKDLAYWRNGELSRFSSQQLAKINAAVEVWVLAKEADFMAE